MPEKDKRLLEALKEHYQNMSNGKDVPEALKERACLVMFRFCIDGEVDGMHICNIIASESGFGDGRGRFTGPVRIKARRCAEALVDAYPIGHNALDELSLILEDGRLDYSMARAGILRDIREAKEQMRRSDGWKQDFIGKRNGKRQQALALLVQTLGTEDAHI